LIHRLHFAFTITFHYLFPQLTMGLGLPIVVLKSVALKTGDEKWDRAARFWGRIFGINFVFGVVTGIPMEFEFGTNWARFSRLSGACWGLYPTLLPATTGADRDITLAKATSGPHTLAVGFAWWLCGMVLAVGYVVFVYTRFRGKVELQSWVH
jgi:hypothetical protein